MVNKLHSTIDAGVHVSNSAGIFLEAPFLKSLSKEVAVKSRIVGQDAVTTIGNNLLSLSIVTGLNAKAAPISKIKEALEVKMMVPEADSWRLPLVSKYIQIRNEQKTACENTDYIDDLLSSLCSS